MTVSVKRIMMPYNFEIATLIIGRKGRLRGYVFRSVCQSFCPRGLGHTISRVQTNPHGVQIQLDADPPL